MNLRECQSPNGSRVIIRFCPYLILCIQLLAVSYGVPQLPAQQISVRRMSLPDLEKIALAKNLGLATGRLDVAQAQSDIITAGLRPNPVATLNADILPIPGEGFDPNGKQYGLSVALPFEMGGKREYRLENAQNLVIVQRYQLLNTARQTLLAVRLAYYDVLGAQEQLSIADANLESYRKLVSLNETRFKASQISQTEFSRSELAYEQADLQRREAELTYTKSQRALRFAVGYSDAEPDANQEISPIEKLSPLLRDSLAILPITPLLTRAVERRYDVLAVRNLRTAAESNRRLQEANAVPDISVAPEFTMQQGVAMYGVTGAMPLPFNNRNEGERQKATLRLQQTEQQIALAELTVRSEVQTAYAEFQTRLGSLQRFHVGSRGGNGATVVGQTGILTRANDIKTASELAYKAGSISLLEFLDAVRIYNDIYKSYIDAVVQFNKSAMLLDAALGADTITLD